MAAKTHGRLSLERSLHPQKRYEDASLRLTTRTVSDVENGFNTALSLDMAGGASIIFPKLNNCQEAAYKSKKLASHTEFSIVILTANAVVGTSVQAVSSRPLKG